MSERPVRAGLTLFVVSAAILFHALDLSITQVGLPRIERDLAFKVLVLDMVRVSDGRVAERRTRAATTAPHNLATRPPTP